jgi:hypothetical protein
MSVNFIFTRNFSIIFSLGLPTIRVDDEASEHNHIPV